MIPRAITAGELVKLRSNGQWSKIKMIIDSPDVVYAGTVSTPLLNTDYGVGSTPVSGNIANCLPEMTLLIGSTAGASDKGIARLRELPVGTTLFVGADLSLDTEVGDHLTVINDFRIFAKHDFGTTIDVSVHYDDQFTNFIPTAVIEGGRVSVIEAGGTAQFDASHSYCFDSSVSSYAWTFTGATSSTNPTTATPTATYNTSGRYRWKLVLTGANAKTETVYGWVYVLGDNLEAETDFIVDTIEGSEDGWGCNIKMYDRPTIKDGARVVLFAEDYYDNELGSIGPVVGKENIVFNGWIIGETIVRDPGKDIVEFEVGGPLAVCSRIFTKPAGLVNPDFPTDAAGTVPDWSKMDSLTAAKAVHYLINYRSNLAMVCDFFTGDWGYAVHKLATDATNLLSQLDDFAGNSIQVIRADRFGVIYSERDGQLYAIADRTADIPVVMTLVDGDWQEDLAIVRRQTGEVAMAEIEGYIFSGTTLTPVGGRSPGNFPARYGDLENISELNFSSQANALEFAGLLAGSKNAEIEGIVAILTQNNRFIDMTRRAFVNVTVDGDTLRCYPRRVTFRRLEGTGFWFTELELEPEGGQWPAVAIDYPDEGEPPVEPPTEPPVEPPEPPDDPGDDDDPTFTGAQMIVVTGSDIRYCQDLTAEIPAWISTITGGPTAPIDSDIAHIVIPSASTDAWIQILYVLEDDKLWKSSNAWVETPAWEDVSGVPVEGTECHFMRVRVAISEPETVYVLGYGTDPSDSVSKPFVLRSANRGQSWTQYWVNEPLAEREYTVTYKKQVVTGTGYFMGQVSTVTHTRIGDDEATYNPWAMAWRGKVSGGWPWTCNLLAAANTIHAFGGSQSPLNGRLMGCGNTLLGLGGAAGEAWLNDYFGAGGWGHYAGISQTMPKEANRVEVKILGRIDKGQSGTYESWVFWDKPSVEGMGKAFDVSRTNHNWIYIGLENKIIKSENGGETWITLTTDEGANDILVDPLAAGVIYYWSTDGGLKMMYNGLVTSPIFDTETPTEIPLRIARQMNGGYMWEINTGTTLKVRYLGTLTTAVGSLVEATGLHAYLASPVAKLVAVDSTKIWYCDGSGTSFIDVTGDWAGYSGGVNAHLLADFLNEEV